MDNIRFKADLEGRSVIERAYRRMTGVVPVRNKLVQELATITGVGGLGAAAMFAGPVRDALALGFGGYYGGKWIMGPQAKEIVGALLRNVDDAIKVTKDKNLIRELRADRAILLEMLKSTESDQEDMPEQIQEEPTDLE